MTYPPEDYSFDMFAESARDTATYAGRGEVAGLVYAVLGLAGEAGEVANQVKKVCRDDQGLVTAERRDKVIDEMSDCLWYLQAIADELDVDLADVARHNVEKLAARKASNTIHGDRRGQ